MASRRLLKKNVNYIVGELFTECLIRCMNTQVDREKSDQTLIDILQFQNEFVCRISHTEPGNVKNYYKVFRKDFNERLSHIVDAIDALK